MADNTRQRARRDASPGRHQGRGGNHVSGCAEQAGHPRGAQTLPQAEGGYQRLFEEAVLGIFRCAPDGSRLFSVNPAYARMLGYRSPEELLAQVKDLAREHCLDPARYRALLARALEGPCGEELHYRRRDGSICVGNLRVWRVATGDSGETVLEGFVEDVSAHRQAEEELARERHKLALLAAELSRSEDRERRRIADVLHDQVGQTLALCWSRVHELERGARQDSPALQELGDMLDCAIRSIRSLTTQLSPPMLYLIGLDASLQWLGAWFKDNYGLSIAYARAAEPAFIPEELRTTLYQCVRELLVNVAKHARVPEARLSVSYAEQAVQITVADAGTGFAVEEVLDGDDLKGGHGLFNVMRRIEYHGGRCSIDSAPGRGTRITIKMPLPPDLD